MRWTAVPIVLKPQFKVNGIRSQLSAWAARSAPFLERDLMIVDAGAIHHSPRRPSDRAHAGAD